MTAYDTYKTAHETAESTHAANVNASRLTRETAIRAAELARIATDPSRSNPTAGATQTAATAAADAAHRATVAASAKVKNAALTAAWLTLRNSGSWIGHPGGPPMDAAAWQS